MIVSHGVEQFHEVWLLDTGHFLIVDQVSPAWREDPRWMVLMRVRRKLRMFVPTDELTNLPGIEASLEVARGCFEMIEAVRRQKNSGDFFAVMGLVERFANVLPTEERSAVKQVPSHSQFTDPIKIMHPKQRVSLKADPTVWGKVTCAGPSHTWYEVTWFNWNPAYGDPNRDFLPNEIRDDTLPLPPKNESSAAWAKRRVREGLEDLVLAGHIRGIDENGDPVAHPKRFSIQELGDGASMANVAVAMKIFPSLGQARKNGFNQPLTLGVHSLTKKKVMVEIVP